MRGKHFEATVENQRTLKRKSKRFTTESAALDWVALKRGWKLVDLRDGRVCSSIGWHPGAGIRID